MIVYLLFCICISSVSWTGKALFLPESPRRATGQMETGQLETTEFKTIIIIYPRQIKTKATSVAIMWLLVPILPPLSHQATHRNTENFPGGSGSHEPTSYISQLPAVSLFLGEYLGKNGKNTTQVSSQERANSTSVICKAIRSLLPVSNSQSNSQVHCLLCVVPHRFSRKRETDGMSSESCKPFNEFETRIH